MGLAWPSLRVSRARAAAAAVAVAGASIASAWGVAGHSRVGAALLAISLLVAAVGIVTQLEFVALLLWAPISVVTYPLFGHQSAHSYVTVDRVVIGALAILLLIVPRARQAAAASRMLTVALVLFTVGFGLRAVAAPASLSATAPEWLDVLVLPLILFCVVRRAVARDARWLTPLAGALAVAGFLLAAIGIAEELFGFELATRTGGLPRVDPATGLVRVSGPYAVPEVYGLSVAICLAATMYFVQCHRRRRRWPFVVVGVGFALTEAVALGFTLFRASWLAGLAVVVVSIALRPRRFVRLAVVGAVVLGVTAVVALQLQHVPGLSTRLDNTHSVFARLASYEQGWKVFEQHPLAGVGVDRYTAFAARIPAVAVHGVAAPLERPHSSFVLILSEQGIAGFVLLLIVAASVVRLVIALERRATARDDVVLAACAIGATLAYAGFSVSLAMLTYGPSNAFFLAFLGAVAGRLDRLSGAGEPQQLAAASA